MSFIVLRDGHEIALIYYRTGYAPTHFDEEVNAP